jgi:hypothetical protein
MRPWYLSLFASALGTTGLLLALSSQGCCATGEEVQARLTADLAEGRPVVVHVVVALCDNANQGIVPVADHLGNGPDPRTNLYWGALYGVRTFLPRHGGWTILSEERPTDARILARVVLFRTVQRDGSNVPVYLVADAWDGAEIEGAVERFLDMSAARASETVSVKRNSMELSILAGGSAHVVAYAGHNGLMDSTLPPPQKRSSASEASSAIVLACASRGYFLDHLHTAGAHPLLLTTGLMAPEAYTLDAAVRAWIGGGSVADVREAGAVAYDLYQKCGKQAALRLFWGAS